MSLTVLQHFVFLFFALFLLAGAIDPNFKRSGPGLRGNESDYKALLAIKDEIFYDPDSVLSSWNTTLHFCEWEGVTCGHEHRRVVSLNLSSNKLAGSLSPFIGNLSFLHYLDFSNNSFRGSIPHQISHLPRLQELRLYSNSLEGKIPANLSHCIHLIVLVCSHNNLEGRVPIGVATLPYLRDLGLSYNHFSGQLKDVGIRNMSSSLELLYLHDNQLEGSIPDVFGNLKGLLELALNNNMLSGIIPPSIFNLSYLASLDLSMNKISGNLPQDLGLRLPKLQDFAVYNNSLVGQVPTSLSNLSELQFLDLSLNNFKGEFSFSGKDMPNLMYLTILFAFSSEEARNLGFVDTLTNCTNLEVLEIDGNSFTGPFPHSILNLSISLQALTISSNQISGYLPFGLGRFVNLYSLNLSGNKFIGPIPTDITKLKRLEVVSFASNNFLGEIPSSLGNLTYLSRLFIRNNNLEGSLPKSIGNCRYLQMLHLSSNKLSGGLSVELFLASSLISLDISQNNFNGSLPDKVSMLKNLVSLFASDNRFSGEIPSTLGGCTSLTTLELSNNSFVGSIPKSLSPLKSIQILDLSCNHLSGQIPNYFSSWPYLSYLNLSFNNLEGEVPNNGVFANSSVVSVVGNKKLCGGVFELHLQRCPSMKVSKRRRLSLALIVIICVACALIVILSVALCFYLFCYQRRRKDASSELQNIKPFLKVSYEMLSRATNGFSSSNLIGVGGFGSVYKGILHQDDAELVVAVKVMKLQTDGAGKSFLAECKALRNIRHRNLVKIITACSSVDTLRNNFKALIYEFMPRGNLEGWLYPNHVADEHVNDDKTRKLSLFQRLNIAIDVASALEYLHVGCASPIIHCDLKPSNILIDDDMTARIGDFGLVKFRSGASTSGTTSQLTSSNQVRGTVGYVAPEYGLGSKASPEGDIYSFGIVVLEMMTSKKPTDPMFNDGLNLHDYSNSALPNGVMEIIDQVMLGDTNVLHPRTGGDIKKIECIKSLIMVGVQCSMELPQERMSISNALNELKSTRQNFLPGGPNNQITL